MIAQRTKRLMALLGAALLASMLSVFALASPAAAAPYWQTVSKTSKFFCEGGSVISGMTYEACVVVNGNYTQSVLIAHNNTGGPRTISATVDLWQAGERRGEDFCYQSTLNTGLQRACFGETFYAGCGVAVQAENYLILGPGVYDGRQSRTRLMCSS